MKRKVLITSFFLWILFIPSLQLNAQWWPVPFPDSGLVNAISANGDYIYAGLLGFSSGLTSVVYRSTDNGASWQTSSHGLPAKDDVYKFAFIDTSVLVGTDHGLYRSSDQGDNWLSTGFTGQVVDIVVAPNGNGDTNIYVAEYPSIFVSSNRGLTWQSNGWRNKIVTSLAASGSNIFALTFTYQGGKDKDSVFLSTDYGSSWNAVMNGLPDNSDGGNIIVADSNIFITLSPLVFSSTDNGKNWQQVNNCPTNQTNTFLFANHSFIFAGNTNGIYFSTDYGNSWIDTKYPSGEPFVYTIAISNDLIFASPAINNGVLARPLHTLLGVEEQSNTRPTRFELEQNFPDPFNPTTTIQFALPHESQVTLKVYNLLGQEVQTLVNETRTAGSYNVEVDASHYSSGVYFYRLLAGTVNQVKKMLLIK